MSGLTPDEWMLKTQIISTRRRLQRGKVLATRWDNWEITHQTLTHDESGARDYEIPRQRWSGALSRAHIGALGNRGNQSLRMSYLVQD